ncbi:MAG: hypothetical protein V7638_3254 [Acidobacteriota bacterium]
MDWTHTSLICASHHELGRVFNSEYCLDLDCGLHDRVCSVWDGAKGSMGSIGMDHRLRGARAALHLRVQFLSRVESGISLSRNCSPNRCSGRDQLGRRSLHQLRGCDFMDRRCHVVVVCGSERVSSPALAADVDLAQLSDLYHFQCDGCI